MISVVIPSYQRKDSVLQLLESVYQQRNAEFEVILVDDNSTDDTAGMVALMYPQTKLMREKINRGPSVCRNRGIWEARGELIIGLDSDTTLPDPNTFRKAIEIFAECPDLGGAAFHIFGPNGQTEDVDRWWHPLPITRFANKRFYTDYFSGTAYAFRKKVLIEARGFPEKFFMHYEEVELAYRVWDNNRSIIYFSELVVVHHENRVSRRSEARSFYKPRNQILLTIDCYPIVRGLVFLIPRTVYALLRSVIQRHFLIFLKALYSAAKLAPQCWIDRKPLKPETWRKLANVRNGTYGQ